MGWLLAIILGAIWGLIYAYSTRGRNYTTGIITGIVGSILGLWFFGNLLRIGFGLVSAPFFFTFLGLIWSIVGTVIVAAIVTAATRTSTAPTTGHSYTEEIRRRRRDDRDDDLEP